MRDKTFTVFAIASIAVTGVLCALAGAWLWGLVKLDLPYYQADDLWFVQFRTPGLHADAYGSEMQASNRAVRDFVLGQSVFDQVTVGTRVEARVGLAEDSGEHVSVLDVAGNFWDVLGVHAAHGRLPHVGAGEVAVTNAWAQRHADGARQALGSSLTIDGAAYRIVGVMGKAFVAPMLFARQRNAGAWGAPEVYRPIDFAVADGGGERARPMLLVGRSTLPRRALAAASSRFLSQVNAAKGRARMMVVVQPLSDHMRGADLTTAGALLAVAVLLALTTLGGLGMLAAARYRARSGDQFVLTAIGAPTWGTTVFELVETLLIVACVILLSLGLSTLGLGVLANARTTVGVVDAVFVARFAGLLCIFLVVFVGALLWVSRLGRRSMQAQGAVVRATRGAARSGIHRWLFRALIMVQTLVALLVITVMLVLVHNGLGALRTAYANDYAGLSEWQLEFSPSAHISGEMAPVLAQIKQSAEALSGVKSAAIMLANSSLDLTGALYGYHGPKIANAKLLSHKGGESIIRIESDGATQNGPDTVNYRVSVVAVEPMFFTMMGYQLDAGRVFAEAESDVAMLTPEAALAIFGHGHAVVGETIPTAPQTSRGAPLHPGVTVVGVVNTGRVGQANLLGDLLAAFPVVFVPYDPARNPTSHGSRKATIVIKHDGEVALDGAVLSRMLKRNHIVEVRGRSVSLQREVQKRLRRHMVSSLGTLSLGGAVLLAALLGAMGGMRWNCQQRSSEIAVRIAMGGRTHQVAFQLGREELLLPLILSLMWLAACTVVGTALSVTGAGSALGAGNGLAAALLVLLTLSGGFLLGVLGPLGQPPMQALRAE